MRGVGAREQWKGEEEQSLASVIWVWGRSSQGQWRGGSRREERSFPRDPRARLSASAGVAWAGKA